MKLTENDILYLEGIVNKFVLENEVCHYKIIYDYILYDNPDLLTNNFVYLPYSLFSILEFIFKGKYTFSRPFITYKGGIIDKPFERISEIVINTNKLYVTDLMTYAKEYHYHVLSILDYINMFNETHLLINRDEIAAIEYIGINEELTYTIERSILDEITSTKSILELKCISSFPKINVEWNEWLIYSILNKWSKRLQVSTSSNIFRKSVPLVTPRGVEINERQYKNKMVDSDLGQIDDLDNLDELIADIIEF